MSKNNKAAKQIIALAFFHRYGWIIVMMALWFILPHQMLYYTTSVCFIVFSIWSFIGYKRKWRHIFCSYQNAYRRKMTPHSIHWQKMKKSDAYGVPLIFFIMGLALLCVQMLP